MSLMPLRLAVISVLDRVVLRRLEKTRMVPLPASDLVDMPDEPGLGSKSLPEKPPVDSVDDGGLIRRDRIEERLCPRNQVRVGCHKSVSQLIISAGKGMGDRDGEGQEVPVGPVAGGDRKSTRLNS